LNNSGLLYYFGRYYLAIATVDLKKLKIKMKTEKCLIDNK
jgi:hypothetical protein